MAEYLTVGKFSTIVAVNKQKPQKSKNPIAIISVYLANCGKLSTIVAVNKQKLQISNSHYVSVLLTISKFFTIVAVSK